MAICEVCFSTDMVKGRTKKAKKELVICKECHSIYELDNNGKLVVGHDPNDKKYFKKLKKMFKSWDNMENIVPYKAE